MKVLADLFSFIVSSMEDYLDNALIERSDLSAILEANHDIQPTFAQYPEISASDSHPRWVVLDLDSLRPNLLAL